MDVGSIAFNWIDQKERKQKKKRKIGEERSDTFVENDKRDKILCAKWANKVTTCVMGEGS